MRCDGFPTEDYDAYALGTLESEADPEIDRHLRESCETCLPRVKQSLSFWALFGAVVAPAAERPREGRVRVVPLIRNGRPASSGGAPRKSGFSWSAIAIAASLVLVTGVAAWYAGSAANRALVAELRTQLDTAASQAKSAVAGSADTEAQLKARAQQVADLQALLAQREQQVQALLKARTELANSLQIAQAKTAEGNRILQALSLPNTRLIPVPGTDVAPGATGYALLAENNRVVFHANNLPPLPAGRVYQLWLIRDQAPQIVSGGVFTASSARSGEVEFTQANLIQRVQAIAVTDEPAGGSPGPTGQKLLVGAVKS